jgi:hypothetical protein
VTEVTRLKRTTIPGHISAAIRKAWPDGVVEPFDSEESYFWKIREKLSWDIRGLGGGMLSCEREASPQRDWHNDDDAWENIPEQEPERSYHTFFLAPLGDEFTHEVESDFIDSEFPEEEDEEVETTGTGRIGCLAAVSLVTRFGIVTLSELVEYEHRDYDEPTLGPPGGWDAHFKELLGAKQVKQLDKLRAEMTQVLESHRVRVLAPDVLRQTVPGLRADNEVLLSEPITVQDTFFFHML